MRGLLFFYTGHTRDVETQNAEGCQGEDDIKARTWSSPTIKCHTGGFFFVKWASRAGGTGGFGVLGKWSEVGLQEVNDACRSGCIRRCTT